MQIQSVIPEVDRSHIAPVESQETPQLLVLDESLLQQISGGAPNPTWDTPG